MPPPASLKISGVLCQLGAVDLLRARLAEACDAVRAAAASEDLRARAFPPSIPCALPACQGAQGIPVTVDRDMQLAPQSTFICLTSHALCMHWHACKLPTLSQ